MYTTTHTHTYMYTTTHTHTYMYTTTHTHTRTRTHTHTHTHTHTCTHRQTHTHTHAHAHTHAQTHTHTHTRTHAHTHIDRHTHTHTHTHYIFLLLQLPPALPQAKLLQPPPPITHAEDNWPMLTVSKSVFEGSVAKKGDLFTQTYKYFTYITYRCIHAWFNRSKQFQVQSVENSVLLISSSHKHIRISHT